MALWYLLLSVPRHHSETADPDLLEWIKGALDHLFNLGSWTVVVALGVLITALPLGLVTLYLVQQRRNPSPRHPTSR